MWPYPRLLGIEMPFIQAALGGANGSAMAVAASEADGLGFLPCAMLDADKIRAEIGVVRQQTAKRSTSISSVTVGLALRLQRDRSQTARSFCVGD